MFRLRDTNGRFSSAKIAMAEAKAKKVAGAAKKNPIKVDFGGNYRTAQIYSCGFEFAFMSKVEEVWKQICTFVYCKDFFHDLVWAFVNKTKWQIYGFKYDSEKDLPLETNNCVFAFRNTDYKSKPAEFHAQREACQEFLNQFEAKIGLAPSQIHEVPHPDAPCWLIIGDKGWQIAPPMLGLYTLLIRVGFAHPKGTSFEDTLKLCREGKIKVGDGRGAGQNDPGYIKNSWQGIQAVLKHGLDTFHPEMKDNYPKSLPDGLSLHDAVGPVSWSQGRAKTAMPRWYKYL